MKSTCGRRTPAAGATLLEALVALALLGAVSASLVYIFGAGARLTAHGRKAGAATELAANEAERLKHRSLLPVVPMIDDSLYEVTGGGREFTVERTVLRDRPDTLGGALNLREVRIRVARMDKKGTPVEVHLLYPGLRQ